MELCRPVAVLVYKYLLLPGDAGAVYTVAARGSAVLLYTRPETPITGGENNERRTTPAATALPGARDQRFAAHENVQDPPKQPVA